MIRLTASPRLLAGFALTAAVGSGIGLAAAGIGPFSATPTPPALHALTAAASTAAAPVTGAPSTAAAPAPLTLDQATAVALQASPGLVVDVQQENGTAEATDPAEPTDPTEAADPTEPTDPTEAADPAEPTGLVSDVTVRHQDGSATKVVVDGRTGRVVSTEAEDTGN